jgi:hypothetical protein
MFEHHLDRVGVTGSIPVQITKTTTREALMYKAFFLFKQPAKAILKHQVQIRCKLLRNTLNNKFKLFLVNLSFVIADVN